MWEDARETLADAGEDLPVSEIWNRIKPRWRSSSIGTLHTVLRRKTKDRTEEWTNKNRIFYELPRNPTRFGLLEWREKAHIAATPKPTSGKELKIKDESDVEAVYDALKKSKKQRHNQLTNQLLGWATSAGLHVKEGNANQARYDALLIDPDAAMRQVLVEAKSSCDIANVRFAIGQLLDYVRHLPDGGETDIAILLPEHPPQNVIDFIHHVDELIPTRSVLAIWFGPDDYLEFSTDTPPPLFAR